MARQSLDGSCYVVTDPSAPLDVNGVATEAKQDVLAGLVGEVQASPTANTLLDRLKTIASKIPSLGAAAASGCLPVTLATDSTIIGTVTETAPASDTASSGLNGRLQRIAQRLTSLIGLLPTSLVGGRLDVNVGAIGVATPAGENIIGKVRGSSAQFSVTFSLDTAQYASGDVLADTQPISGVMAEAGGTALLHSIVLNDKDDKGQAIDIVLLKSNVTLGTENSPPSISDANADEVLGTVSVSAADWNDLGGCRIATKPGIGLLCKSAAGSTDLYVALICKGGTPTYTASGITGKFGFASVD